MRLHAHAGTGLRRGDALRRPWRFVRNHAHRLRQAPRKTQPRRWTRPRRRSGDGMADRRGFSAPRARSALFDLPARRGRLHRWNRLGRDAWRIDTARLARSRADGYDAWVEFGAA